jgi:hypothetical protein
LKALPSRPPDSSFVNVRRWWQHIRCFEGQELPEAADKVRVASGAGKVAAAEVRVGLGVRFVDLYAPRKSGARDLCSNQVFVRKKLFFCCCSSEGSF